MVSAVVVLFCFFKHKRSEEVEERKGKKRRATCYGSETDIYRTSSSLCHGWMIMLNSFFLSLSLYLFRFLNPWSVLFFCKMSQLAFFWSRNKKKLNCAIDATKSPIKSRLTTRSLFLLSFLSQVPSAAELTRYYHSLWLGSDVGYKSNIFL